MESYLPLIKSTLSEWYLFTLDNALYATALAIAVWVLSALLYNIKIAGIKRAKAASEKAANDSLNAMQQQLQQSQEHLAATVEAQEQAQTAVDKEAQKALTLEQLIYQRNQQIAGIIQTLAGSFDLGERPLPAGEDVKAEALWQQHDKVITQLIERLRAEATAKLELQQTYQLETAKLAEKETLVNLLQTTLDQHSHQLSNLEQALQEQKTLLLHQDTTQQALTDTLKNFQPSTATRAVEPETAPVSDTWQQPAQVETSPVIEAPLISQPEPMVQVAEVNINPTASASWLPEQATIEPIITSETVEPWFPKVSPQPKPQPQLKLEPVDEIVSSQPLIEEQTSTAPAKGSLGKIKNLFGKKQQPIKTEPQWTDTQTDEPSPAATEPQPADEAPKNPGKLKGFYSKLRAKK